MSLVKKIKNKFKRKFPWLLPLLSKIPFLKKSHLYIPEKLQILPLPKKINQINANKIKFSFEATPQVTIIISVHNQWPYTYNTLVSLAAHASESTFEVIVVNDTSTDETSFVLSQAENIKTIDNSVNQGFIKSCNNASLHARGKYLLFLNNDIQVQPNWLDALVETLEKNKEIGLVGSKLIYPNGQLQEAGAIIWKNATAHNFGRLQNRSYPEYNFTHITDYVSGASMLIAKSLFSQLHNFDERYVPAYYEDTDLAMKVRQSGKTVVIQPQSEIVHFEGISSGTDIQNGVKQYQKQNQIKFSTKWTEVLNTKHLPNNNTQPIENIIRKNGNKVVLIVDYWVPKYDQNSGSNRLFQIIKILKELNYYVVFLPDDGAHIKPYTLELQQMGVHVLYHTIDKTAQEHCQAILKYIDYAWLCNPYMCQKYMPLLLKGNANLKVIYDTIDLHYIRMKREAELQHKKPDEYQKMQVLETDLAQKAAIVLGISDDESAKLRQITKSKVFTVPNIHNYIGSQTDFINRNGLLFIGGYHHQPNVDAATWLVNEIMPLIWSHAPDVPLILLGSNPPPQIEDMAKDKRISVPGFIKDISPYFNQSRVFVSPLRYGAGMKGKIGQALEYGLPVVSTNVGTEGMFLENNIHVIVANNTIAFANKTLELYNSPELWLKISNNATKALAPFSTKIVKEKLKTILT
jgi:O-antigen biosynthesis protein